jgi:hypothetical protein
MKITYKMIADYIGQSESNIKQLKKKNPQKLELYKYGLLYMIENELIKVENLKT